MIKKCPKCLTGSTKSQEIYIVLQNIRSLFNVGSIFRSADVFKIDKIFLCGYTGYPPRDQISKTALGAQDWIPWEKARQTPTLLKKLKKQGFQIVALETGKKTKPLPKFKPKFPIALVLGNEVKGLTKNVLDIADEIVEIPMHGKKDSLNVSNAASVAMYDLNLKRK